MDKEINNNGYDYVDLELPSGTLWATCNVGAKKSTDCGLYFQWGGTKGYAKEQIGKDKPFSKDKYKWSVKGCDKHFIKYTTEVAILDFEDDAVHVHMGGSWHMPTPNQIKELIDNMGNSLTAQNGVMGMEFTSKNGKSIFIPAAGEAWDGIVCYDGLYGCLWSSMVSSLANCYSQYLYFDLWGAKLYYGRERWLGMSVRGVIG